MFDAKMSAVIVMFFNDSSDHLLRHYDLPIICIQYTFYYSVQCVITSSGMPYPLQILILFL